MPKNSIASERSTSLFNTSYTWYIELVSVCGGIIVLYLLFGCLKSLWNKRKSRKIDYNQMKVEGTVDLPSNWNSYFNILSNSLKVAMIIYFITIDNNTPSSSIKLHKETKLFFNSTTR